MIQEMIFLELPIPKTNKKTPIKLNRTKKRIQIIWSKPLTTQRESFSSQKYQSEQKKNRPMTRIPIFKVVTEHIKRSNDTETRRDEPPSSYDSKFTRSRWLQKKVRGSNLVQVTVFWQNTVRSFVRVKTDSRLVKKMFVSEFEASATTEQTFRCLWPDFRNEIFPFRVSFNTEDIIYESSFFFVSVWNIFGPGPK